LTSSVMHTVPFLSIIPCAFPSSPFAFSLSTMDSLCPPSFLLRSHSFTSLSQGLCSADQPRWHLPSRLCALWVFSLLFPSLATCLLPSFNFKSPSIPPKPFLCTLFPRSAGISS
jgi:hypothetical protein